MRLQKFNEYYFHKETPLINHEEQMKIKIIGDLRILGYNNLDTKTLEYIDEFSKELIMKIKY